jgi:hypothetical protein
MNRGYSMNGKLETVQAIFRSRAVYDTAVLVWPKSWIELRRGGGWCSRRSDEPGIRPAGGLQNESRVWREYAGRIPEGEMPADLSVEHRAAGWSSLPVPPGFGVPGRNAAVGQPPSPAGRIEGPRQEQIFERRNNSLTRLLQDEHEEFGRFSTRAR